MSHRTSAHLWQLSTQMESLFTVFSYRKYPKISLKGCKCKFLLHKFWKPDTTLIYHWNCHHLQLKGMLNAKWLKLIPISFPALRTCSCYPHPHLPHHPHHPHPQLLLSGRSILLIFRKINSFGSIHWSICVGGFKRGAWREIGGRGKGGIFTELYKICE